MTTPEDHQMTETTAVPVPPRLSCRVYWGSHGCRLERGHPGMADSHDCGCCECASHPDPDPENPGGESSCVGRYPYYGAATRFYGEDAEALGLPLGGSQP